MDDPISRAEARVQRYWNVDGLHEIAAALLFALTALWLWAEDLSPLSRPWRGAFGVTFPVMLCGGMWAEKRVVAALRKHLTYPRAGFVAFRKPPRRKRMIAGAVAAAIAALLVIFVFRDLAASGQAARWIVAFLGLGIGVFLWTIGSSSAQPRFYIVGTLQAAIGLAIPLAGVDFSPGMALYWLLTSIVLLISGALALWRFLHATPIAEAQ